MASPPPGCPLKKFGSDVLYLRLIKAVTLHGKGKHWRPCEKVGFNVKSFCINPGSGHVLMASYMGLICNLKENLLNVFSLFVTRVESGWEGREGDN